MKSQLMKQSKSVNGFNACACAARKPLLGRPIRGVDTEPGTNVSSSGCSGSQLTANFSRLPVSTETQAVLQPKLKINAAGDSCEKEADLIANQVLQNKGFQEHTEGYGNAAHGAMQRVSVKSDPVRSNDSGRHAAPSIVYEVLRSPGRPLDLRTREFVEPRLGYDFSRVRVHTDSRSAESADAVNARAYTVGRDVVFGAGFFKPESSDGQKLLVHELTHVMQQDRNKGVSRLQRDELAEEGEEIEDEDVDDGDTDVPGLDSTPDLDLPFFEHGPEPQENPAEEALSRAPAGNEPESMGAEPEGRKPALKPSGKIKSIDVDLTAQSMTLFYDNNATTTHTVSTGRGKCGTTGDPCKTQNETNCTPKGTFTIVSRGNYNTKNSKGDKMAWFVGLAVPGRKGIGIHNSQIADGRPRSHGCIRTGTDPGPGLALAKTTNEKVRVGSTKVAISGKAKTRPYKCKKK